MQAPIATLNTPDRGLSFSNGIASFTNTQLTPDQLKLIGDMFAAKFTDNTNTKSTNTHGSRALLEGLLLPVDDPKAAALLTEARGLWPDPVTLYYVGRFQNQTGDFESAAATLDMLEEARGRAYRLFFPGLVGLGRVERARSLERMSRFEDAARLYRQVLEDWGDRASRFKIAQNVRSEYRRLISANPKLRGK